MAKILVVDDDPDIRFAVSLCLRQKGYEVQTAANRVDGMAAITSDSPDLLILDVMMDLPDDGIAMAQELRRSGRKLPIVMLTSVGKVTGMHFDKNDDLVPVDAFFEKPVRPDELLQKVQELLGDRGA